MRLLVSVLFGVGVALLVAACSGAEHESTLRLSADDVTSLVAVSPEATGWRWTAKPKVRFRSARQIAQTRLSHAIQVTLRDAELEAGLVRAGTSSWWENGKKASAFATVFATPEGARSAIAAGETFAHAWFTEVEGQAIRESDAAELGERRWAVQGGSDTAAFVEIEWTRANAVLSVYVNCSPCASDVTEAARRWAEAMDERVPTLAE